MKSRQKKLFADQCRRGWAADPLAFCLGPGGWGAGHCPESEGSIDLPPGSVCTDPTSGPPGAGGHRRLKEALGVFYLGKKA